LEIRLGELDETANLNVGIGIDVFDQAVESLLEAIADDKTGNHKSDAEYDGGKCQKKSELVPENAL